MKRIVLIVLYAMAGVETGKAAGKDAPDVGVEHLRLDTKNVRRIVWGMVATPVISNKANVRVSDRIKHSEVEKPYLGRVRVGDSFTGQAMYAFAIHNEPVRIAVLDCEGAFYEGDAFRDMSNALQLSLQDKIEVLYNPIVTRAECCRYIAAAVGRIVPNLSEQNIQQDVQQLVQRMKDALGIQIVDLTKDLVFTTWFNEKLEEYIQYYNFLMQRRVYRPGNADMWINEAGSHEENDKPWFAAMGGGGE